MQRNSLSVLIMLLCLLASSGCAGKKNTTKAEIPANNPTLVIACPEGIAHDVLKAQGFVVANRLGVELKIITRSSGKVPDSDQIKADIWIIKPEETGEFAQANLVAFASDSIQEPGDKINWSDLLPLYREKLLIWQRKIVALPLAGEARVCLYRDDLFNNPIHQNGFKAKFNTPLKPPNTWLDYHKIAQYFSEANFNSGKSLPGLPSSEEDFEKDFLSFAAGYTRQPVSPSEKITPEIENAVFSFQYDFRTGKPLINTTGFVKSLEKYKLLQKFRATLPETESGATFLQGNAALTIADASLVYKTQSNPALKDKFNICSIPGSDGYYPGSSTEFRPLPIGNKIPYLGTSSNLGCVNAKSASKELAFKFLIGLASPEIAERICVEPTIASYTRYSQLDKIRLDAFGLDSQRTASLRETIRANLSHIDIKNPALCSRLPGYQKRRTILVEEVKSYLISPNGSAQETMNKVAQRWIEIDKAWPEKEFQALVKQSVGLIAD